jgi:hypothetical protein
MAKNIAARRHAKALRRKVVVAAKRKADAQAGSLLGQAREAAQQPIQHCLITDSLFRVGMGQVVLARGPTPTDMDVGVFLVDLMPPRIKDVSLAYMTGAELDEYRGSLGASGAALNPIPPEEARKLLHEVEARGQRLGLPSHRDYWAVEALFGSIDAAASDAVFPFEAAGMLGLGGAAPSEEADEGDDGAGPTIEHDPAEAPRGDATTDGDGVPARA